MKNDFFEVPRGAKRCQKVPKGAKGAKHDQRLKKPQTKINLIFS